MSFAVNLAGVNLNFTDVHAAMEWTKYTKLHVFAIEYKANTYNSLKTMSKRMQIQLLIALMSTRKRGLLRPDNF